MANPASTFDSVKLVSNYIRHHDYPRYADRDERDEALVAWLLEYHDPNTPQLRQDYLKNCIFINLFYGMVYVLSEKKFTRAMFDDALQNMSEKFLTALANFDPTLGHKLSHYMIGYLREALDISVRQEFVVYVPKQSRRRAISQAMMAADYQRTSMRDDSDYSDSLEQVEAHTKDPDIVPDLTGDTDYYQQHPSQGFLNSHHNSFDCYTDIEYIPDDIGTDAVVTPPIDYSRIPPKTADVVVPLTAEDMVDKHDMLSLLSKALSQSEGLLTDRELMVIKYRTGVCGVPRLTLEEIAEQFPALGWKGTKEWVHQIEKRAIQKLKKFFLRHNIREYIPAR